MSLFDDDFYSTRVKRSLRFEGRPGERRPPGFRRYSTLRVAVASSLVSAVVVAVLFIAATGGGKPQPVAKPAMAGGQSLVETSEQIVSASDKIRPAVVSIINITKQANVQQPSGGNSSDIPPNASLGSGVIFEKKSGKAYIMTNAHVVADAVQIQAVLMNGEKRKAELVGQDTISDLAVLAISPDGIDAVAEIGSSAKLRVGEMVIAVGNPLGFSDSVSQGIVSFLHRVVPVSLNQDGIYDWEQEVVQTTAPINQGNSGGVLADLNGRVVGINSMKIADTGVEGIGFAIPIDTVMPIVEELVKTGKVLRPYMGVYSMDLSAYLDNNSLPGDGSGGSGSGSADKGSGKDNKPPITVPEGVKDGALVLEATGPAKDAGLKLNDIITALDGHPIRGTMELRKYLYNDKKIGESLTITYYRDGKQAEAKLTLMEKDK